MKRHTTAILPAFIASLALTACVGAKTAQETTLQANKLLKTYEQQSNRAIANQNEVIQDALYEVDRHSLEVSLEKSMLRTLVDAWRVSGDQTAAAAYTALAQDSPQSVVADSPILTPPSTTLEAKAPSLSQDYSTSYKAIEELAKEGAGKERLTALLAILKKEAPKAIGALNP